MSRWCAGAQGIGNFRDYLGVSTVQVRQIRVDDAFLKAI